MYGRNPSEEEHCSLDDVGVESKHTKLVSAHDSRKELHDEDLVVERVVLV